jgi:hypothetical protein
MLRLLRHTRAFGGRAGKVLGREKSVSIFDERSAGVKNGNLRRNVIKAARDPPVLLRGER